MARYSSAALSRRTFSNADCVNSSGAGVDRRVRAFADKVADCPNEACGTIMNVILHAYQSSRRVANKQDVSFECAKQAFKVIARLGEGRDVVAFEAMLSLREQLLFFRNTFRKQPGSLNIDPSIHERGADRTGEVLQVVVDVLSASVLHS